MPSDSLVGIAREALRRIGARPITSFSDPTHEGILANDTFDTILQDYLTEHPWTFCTSRTSLAASATAPEWGYERAYPVPSDSLRILEVDEQKFELADGIKIERHEGGTAILTNLSSPINVKYTALVEDPAVYPPSFREALIWKCAMTWAENLTATSSVVERATIAYQRWDQKAKAADGQQGTPDRMGIDTWVNAR